MFGIKKSNPIQQFDKENYRAVLRCSICTGEQVAGFKNIHTGEFHDIVLIKNADDLETFREMYGVSEISKEYL